MDVYCRLLHFQECLLIQLCVWNPITCFMVTILDEWTLYIIQTCANNVSVLLIWQMVVFLLVTKWKIMWTKHVSLEKGVNKIVIYDKNANDCGRK